MLKRGLVIRFLVVADIDQGQSGQTNRALLRHAVATLAYRGGKALRGAPAEFTDYDAGQQCRTPGQILAHIGDLLDWALSLAQEKKEWHNSPSLPWDKGVERFFLSVRALDDYLASDALIGSSPEKLFQGPLADALTHVGQISLLRRLAGCPVRSENYLRADIAAGRVGADQTASRFEFD
jgi:hypothetical protein